MSWDELSKDRKIFLSQFLPRGKSPKAIYKRYKAKKELANQFEAYQAKSRLVEATIFNIQLSPNYADLENEYEEIETGTLAKGTFAQGLGELDTLLGKIRAERDAINRAASDPSDKLNAFQEAARIISAFSADDDLLIARVSRELIKRASETEDEPINPENLPLVRALPSVYAEGRGNLKTIYEGDLTGYAYEDALNDGVDEIRTKRARIRAEIERMLSSSEELDSAGEVLESDRAYRKALDGCEDLMRDLAFWGHPKAALLEKNLNGVRKDTKATGAYDVGVTALEFWKREAEKGKSSYLTELESALETHKSDLAEVVTRADRIGSNVAPDQRAELDDLIAIAAQTITNAEDDGKGKNLSALRPLQGIIVSASLLSRELLQVEVFNRSIAGLISEIEAILGGADTEGSPEGKSMLPNKYQTLRTKFTDLHGDWLSMAPSAAQTAFIEMKFEAEAFKVEVDAMREWRTRMNAAADEAAKRSRDLENVLFEFGNESHGFFAEAMHKVFGRTGIVYEGTAAKELDVIRADILSEDATTHAFTEKKIQDLSQKLANWLGAAQNLRDAMEAKPPQSPSTGDMNVVAAILQDQKKALEEREANERAVADFVSKCEKVEEMIDRLASDDSLSEETQQKYDDIKQLSKAAKTQALNDLDAAEEMHSRVKFRMTKAMGAPPKAIDNFDWLQKMPAFWQHATADMRDGVQRLIDTVNREAEYETRVDNEQMEDDLRMLTVVSNVFADDAFDAAAAVLGDRGTIGEPDKRRKARETALREVRLFRGYLQSNMLLRHAIRNPFKVDGIGSTLALSLNKIELEVLRGI